jgi:hypothetical protein
MAVVRPVSLQGISHDSATVSSDSFKINKWNVKNGELEVRH